MERHTNSIGQTFQHVCVSYPANVALERVPTTFDHQGIRHGFFISSRISPELARLRRLGRAQGIEWSELACTPALLVDYKADVTRATNVEGTKREA